jgi:hypothetical protein
LGKTARKPKKYYAIRAKRPVNNGFGAQRAEENIQVLARKASLAREHLHEVQDKVLHCSALYGIIMLTKTTYHLPRRREPC